ncbi:MAG: TonB-dependent receptor [Thermodesulfobacteriota bacterium]|nr:TonB-dependent receptor [Thermodesulfobacteriota bacterium]
MHGEAYDFIISRRLWKNINLRADFSYYVMKDYTFISNFKTNETIWGRDVTTVDVNKTGLEIDISGHIIDGLGFYASFSTYDYKIKDAVNAYEKTQAKEEFSNRADYRINAGLDYTLFKNTKLLLDYKYQDDQVKKRHEGVEEYLGTWSTYEIKMDSYHLFDFAVEQKLFENFGFAKNGMVKLYINNLLDEEYEESNGYPATDRTYGIYAKFDF